MIKEAEEEIKEVKPAYKRLNTYNESKELEKKQKIIDDIIEQ